MSTYSMSMPSHPANGPAMAGAAIVVALITIALSAAAFMIMCLGTICGTMACRAGIMNGMMHPWMNAAAIRCVQWIAPV